MAKQPQRRGEPHPLVPHLYRLPQPRTAGADLYPYLPSQLRVAGLRSPAQHPLGKGLLPDATRGAVSQLGGVAKPAPSKGKR
jgi:hypothetical protein